MFTHQQHNWPQASTHLRETRPVVKHTCTERAVQETHPRRTGHRRTHLNGFAIAATNCTQDLRRRSVGRRTTYHPLRIRNVSPLPGITHYHHTIPRHHTPPSLH